MRPNKSHPNDGCWCDSETANSVFKTSFVKILNEQYFFLFNKNINNNKKLMDKIHIYSIFLVCTSMAASDKRLLSQIILSHFGNFISTSICECVHACVCAQYKPNDLDDVLNGIIFDEFDFMRFGLSLISLSHTHISS